MVKGVWDDRLLSPMISVMVVTVLVGLEVTVIVLLMGGTVKGYMVLAKTMFSQVSMRIVLLAVVMELNLIMELIM